MPKLTLDDIVKSRKALEKTVEGFDKERKVMQTRINKAMGEYRTIKEGLEEGAKDINEHKKQLVGSMKTWQTMFTKKLPQIKDKVGEVGKDAAKLRPDIKQAASEAETLMKGLANCAGDVKDMKDENDALKVVKRMADRIMTDYNELEDQATSMPKDPEEPNLKLG